MTRLERARVHFMMHTSCYASRQPGVIALTSRIGHSEKKHSLLLKYFEGIGNHFKALKTDESFFPGESQTPPMEVEVSEETWRCQAPPPRRVGKELQQHTDTLTPDLSPTICRGSVSLSRGAETLKTLHFPQQKILTYYFWKLAR